MMPLVWQEFAARWGYLAIMFATFIEGEVVLISAGALVRTGVFTLPGVVVAAALGSLAWGQTWFYLGKVFGRAIIRRRANWEARASIIEPWLARYGVWGVLTFRFIAGLAIVAPLLIGAGGYSRVRFLFFDALGALLWAGLFGGLGFALGAGLGTIAGRELNLSELLGIALAGTIAVGLLVRSLSKRRRCAGDSGHQTTT